MLRLNLGTRHFLFLILFLPSFNFNSVSLGLFVTGEREIDYHLSVPIGSQKKKEKKGKEKGDFFCWPDQISWLNSFDISYFLSKKSIGIKYYKLKKLTVVRYFTSLECLTKLDYGLISILKAFVCTLLSHKEPFLVGPKIRLFYFIIFFLLNKSVCMIDVMRIIGSRAKSIVRGSGICGRFQNSYMTWNIGICFFS